MNNWRRFLERVDVWVIRFSAEASQHYWGLNNLTPAEALGVFRYTKARPCSRLLQGDYRTRVLARTLLNAWIGL
jgi:hypothetical protein